MSTATSFLKRVVASYDNAADSRTRSTGFKRGGDARATRLCDNGNRARPDLTFDEVGYVFRDDVR